MTVLLKDALQPNLVQTLEHNPAFIHGGPFANIAHGCNTVMATKAALKMTDYVVTEAGFGADLGIHYKFSDKIGETPKTWKIIRIISSLYNAEIYISLRGIFNIRMLRWIWQRKSGLSAQILQQIRRFY